MDEAKLVAASAISLAVTMFALFSLRPLARRMGLVDRPDSRKRHSGRVPLIGGLCFFLGTVVGCLYLGVVDRFVAALLVPCALIVLTGAVDDLHNLSVRSRLIIQTCAAGMVIAATGVYLDATGPIFAGFDWHLGVLGIPVTIFAVIGLINAFNMLDGIDGLAASLAMVSIGCILLFADASLPVLGVTLLLQVLCASLIPYLCINLGWPDGRKVFMGDAGSTLIGFLLAWSLIDLSHGGVARLAPIDAAWCVALPVMDTLAVMLRRLRSGRSPFKPDRQHLHHLLQDTGCSARATLACIVVASGALGLVGFALRNVPEAVSALAFLLVLALYVFRFQAALEWLCRTLKESAMVARVRARLAHPGVPHNARTASPGGPRVLKALCVMATPPDAIRLAPVARQLSADARFEMRVCVTAPADQTPEQVLGLFGIRPDVQLDVPTAGQDPADVAARALGGMKRVLREFSPDVVLVPGNTSSTLATTLAAFYQQIPVVCIEPGGMQARGTANRLDDANRKITRTLASLHFTPNASTGERLLADGVPADRIVVSGNTSLGTVRAAVDRINHDEILCRHLGQCFAFLRHDHPLLLVVDRDGTQFGAACVDESRQGGRPRTQFRRRAEDIKPDDAVIPICSALRRLSLRRPDIDIVYPVDELAVFIDQARQLLDGCDNVHLVGPTDYLSFAYLLNRATGILAESSDLAFEVSAFGKPVLLVEDASGIRAGLDAANVRRVSAHEQAIVTGLLGVLDGGLAAQRVSGTHEASRDACLRIADALAELRHAHAPPATTRTTITTLQVRQATEAMREVT